jgi:hypothetical protein
MRRWRIPAFTSDIPSLRLVRSLLCPPQWIACNARVRLFEKLNDWQLSIGDFGALVQALYRIDADDFRHWFKQHSEQVLSCLRLHTTSLKLHIKDDEVNAEYLVEA